jgi:hypothetical protein
MSTRFISWGKGGRCVRLTTLPPSCAFVTKPGNLNCLEPFGPLQACNGTALHKHSEDHVWIRWTPPVSRNKFSYKTEHVGTCKLQKGDRALGDSGAKDKNLGGHSIVGMFIWTCMKFSLVNDIRLFETTSTKALWMVVKKEITVNCILIWIQCLHDKIFTQKWQICTVHNKRSKIPTSTSVHFATPVRSSRVVSLSRSSRFFMPAAASEMRSSNSSRVSTYL